MRRMIFKYAWLAVAFIAIFALPAGAQSDLRGVAAKMVKDMASDPDAAKLRGEKLMVAEFENINGKGDAVPRIFQEMLTTAFIKDKTFKIVERAQLEKALKELKISASGLVDPDNAKIVGKMLGASYMVVGSISDIGGSVSIDGRLVAIESGESVTAADATIGAESSPKSLVPEGNSKGAENTAKIDLSEKAKDDSAGQTTGKMENFGLLGGTKFKVAWREKLGSTPIFTFASGRITGDDSPRLVTLESESEGHVLGYPCKMHVRRWTNGSFRRSWESGQLLWLANISTPHILVCEATSGLPYLITSFSPASNRQQTLSWRWTGSTYSCTQISNDLLTAYKPGAGSQLVGLSTTSDNMSSTVVLVSLDLTTESPVCNVTTTPVILGPDATVLAADFDGDGKTELAAVSFTQSLEGKPIEIFSLDGMRKAVTEKGYGSRLAVWQPGNVKTPYLVARRNSFDEQHNSNGGYIHFIQWNGESYEEVWKSNKLDDYVIELQICDPKGEGQDGLVVLSSDKKGCYLTKIVAE